MARQRMRGAEYIDIPSLGEIDESVKGAVGKHMTDRFAMFHTEYPDILEQYYADSSGNLNTSDYRNPNVNTTTDRALGPRAGFAWDVKRIVIVNTAGNVGNVAIFKNSGQPSNIVAPSTGCPEYYRFSSEQFVLRPGEHLVLIGNLLGANSTITLTGQVKEVPLNYLGRLSF